MEAATAFASASSEKTEVTWKPSGSSAITAYIFFNSYSCVLVDLLEVGGADWATPGLRVVDLVVGLEGFLGCLGDGDGLVLGQIEEWEELPGLGLSQKGAEFFREDLDGLSPGVGCGG